MSTMEIRQLATARRLCKAVERIADVLERQEAFARMEVPVLFESAKIVQEGITWQDAVLVLSETCKGAESCAEGACPMHEWCQTVLGDDVPAPASWVTEEDRA